MCACISVCVVVCADVLVCVSEAVLESVQCAIRSRLLLRVSAEAARQASGGGEHLYCAMCRCWFVFQSIEIVFLARGNKVISMGNPASSTATMIWFNT